MTQELDPKELRKVAEAATPGPWETLGGQGPFGTHAVCHRTEQGTLVELVYRDAHFDKANATHIATFDPPTVLALLTQLEQAECQLAQATSALKALAERNIEQTEQKRVLNIRFDAMRASRDSERSRADKNANRLEQAEAQVARVREVCDSEAYEVSNEFGDYEAVAVENIRDALAGDPNE